jgi:hypothetical protein
MTNSDRWFGSVLRLDKQGVNVLELSEAHWYPVLSQKQREGNSYENHFDAFFPTCDVVLSLYWPGTPGRSGGDTG